ncbi:MAG TPA: peptidoglycan bridge formation glycyltransferase FemA/FemB family protein [Bacteroidales bacterium]|nr:peptidoglycan bridge formation glycyltransferase FemA/FemB family protein [Bacteroidales bacterium]
MISDFSLKNRRELIKTPIVQQTSFWSEVKKKMGYEPLAFDFSVTGNNGKTTGRISSDVLVLINKAGNHASIAYVPYGPEFAPVEDEQGIFLEELSECIRGFLPADCFMIRYDLFWESIWATDEIYFDDNKWLGPPEKDFQEIRFNINTINRNLRKSGTNNLPSSTVFLDLTKDLVSIRNAMKPKTRYNTELAVRKGVYVIETGDLSVWYNLYRETAYRNRLYLHNIEHFRTVLNVHIKNTQSPAEVILLVAMIGKQPLAAMFLVISGCRATYLYGASSSGNRNFMAPYALQWQAIKIAKEKKCTEYDMFGISPKPDPDHPLYGLYRFKTGFGGEVYHTMGCWDYPFDDYSYRSYALSELKSQGYHIN